MTEYAFEGVQRSSNTVTWSFANQNFPVDAFYPYSNPIDPIYQSTIQAAFARWAAVAGLTFSQVADTVAADIRIGFGIFNSQSTIGQTVIRSTAGTLNQDTVVRLLDPSVAPLGVNAQGLYDYTRYDITLLQVATHEIGHALGLDHTTDPVTIMYPVATTQNVNLALGDVEGINALYPLYTVAAANPVQVEGNASGAAYTFTITRSSDPAAALTIGYGVVGAVYPALAGTVAATGAAFGGVLPSGQVTFAAGSATATLTIKAAANTTPSPDVGFALTLSSINPATPATTRGAVNAVILDDDGYTNVSNGALGIYRFFDAAHGTHFFTASEAERNAVITTRPDMVYEGIDLTAVAAPASDPAAVPIFRFFDKLFGTHFYTSSAAERDTVLATRSDLAFEGTAFYEDLTAQSGDTAVYRFFDTNTGTHFYTSSATERAAIVATQANYVNEGIAFYAPAAA